MLYLLNIHHASTFTQEQYTEQQYTEQIHFTSIISFFCKYLFVNKVGPKLKLRQWRHCLEWTCPPQFSQCGIYSKAKQCKKAGYTFQNIQVHLPHFFRMGDSSIQGTAGYFRRCAWKLLSIRIFIWKGLSQQINLILYDFIIYQWLSSGYIIYSTKANCNLISDFGQLLSDRWVCFQGQFNLLCVVLHYI